MSSTVSELALGRSSRRATNSMARCYAFIFSPLDLFPVKATSIVETDAIRSLDPVPVAVDSPARG